MPIRVEQLAVLDEVCSLLSQEVDSLQGRAIADFSASVPGQLRSPYERAAQRWKLSVRTQDVAQTLCGELQSQLERLRRGDADPSHNRVGFLGTTGSGKSFLMDMLLLLLSVSPEEYASGRRAREARDAISRALEDVLPSGGADAAPLEPAASLEEELEPQPLQETVSGAAGAAAFGTARLRLRDVPAVKWSDELCALAGLMSSMAWPREAAHKAQLAQQAHMRAWDGHNFLLRVSNGGTGTAKFLEIRHAPLYSASVELHTPRDLVFGLRELHKLQKRLADGKVLKEKEQAACETLLHTWRALSGAKEGAYPDLDELYQSAFRRVAYGKYAEHWNLDPGIKRVMKEQVHNVASTSVQLSFGQWDGDQKDAQSKADVARVTARDLLSTLLNPMQRRADGEATPGLDCLVKSAQMGVPFACTALEDIILVDVPGTSDDSVVHSADTRLAIARTKRAVLVLSSQVPGEAPSLAGPAVMELARSPFVQRMLASSDDCSLIVVVSADVCTPALQEEAAAVSALRDELVDTVFHVCAQQLKASARAAPPGEERLDESRIDERLATIRDRLHIIYLRAREAAAAALCFADHQLLVDYCASPAKFGAGAQCKPLEPPARMSEQALRAFLNASGVPRLLEHISAIRLHAVDCLDDVMIEAEGHVREKITEIEQQSIELPHNLFSCFSKWAEHVIGLKRDAARKKVEEIKPRKDVQPLVKEYLKSLVHQVGRKPKKSQRSEARKLLEVELATLQDWQDGSKRCGTSIAGAFSVRGFVFKPLASPKVAAAQLAEKLRQRAAELLARENADLKRMFTPNTEKLRDDFKARYSKDAAKSVEERKVVDSVLKGIMPALAAGVLSSDKLLRRIVKDSMVPRQPATADAAETVAAAAALPQAELTPAASIDAAPSDNDTSDSEMDSTAAAAGDAVDSGVESDDPVASLRSVGLEAALEALFEKHSARQVDAIYAALDIPAEVEDEDAAAEVVRVCCDKLLGLAVDHQRSTFRRLVPRVGGALQRELVEVGMLFFDCVRKDIQTTKAELGSVWKRTLALVTEAGKPNDAAPEASDEALKRRLQGLADKIAACRVRLANADQSAEAGAPGLADYPYGLSCIACLRDPEERVPSELRTLANANVAKRPRSPGGGEAADAPAATRQRE